MYRMWCKWCTWTMEMVRNLESKTKYERKRFSSINQHMAEKWVKQEKQCMCKRNTEDHLHHCCSGKAISITYSVCVCSHSYPACNVLAPYGHLWHALLYPVFQHCLIKGMIFRKKNLLNIKFLLWFPLQLLSEASLVLGRIQWDLIINVHTSLCKVVIMLVTFSMNLQFSWHISIKYWNVKFH